LDLVNRTHFGQLFFNTQISARLKVLLVIVLVASLYVAFVQAYDWKSGWLPPLVAIATMLAIRYWRRVKYISFLAVIQSGMLRCKLFLQMSTAGGRGLMPG